MGMEKIDFIWYMKKMSILALIGYFAGIGTYWAQEHIVGADEEVEEVHNVIEVKKEIINVGEHDHIKLDNKMILKIRKQNEDGSQRHED
jgi:hypothetical protein